MAGLTMPPTTFVIAPWTREQGCNAVHLDSGYQRHAAYRLYLNKGFVLSSHHLALKL